MGSIPVNRRKAKTLGRITQIIPIVAGMPAPARKVTLPRGFTECDSFVTSDVWDEVASETDVVRALPSGRFSRFLGEQAILPHRVAERLEDFETCLRSLGLVAVDEKIVQAFDDPRKFRVQKANVAIDRGHDIKPYHQKRRQRRSLF